MIQCTCSPRIRRARRLCAVPAVVALVATAPAWAAETPAGTAMAAAQQAAPAKSAAQFIRTVGDKVIDVLQAHPAKQERAAELESIFRNAFDVPGMARFAAGLYWRRTSPAERQKYVDVFGKYVANLYAMKFADYQGQKFAVTGQRAAGNSETAVETQIVSSDKKTPVVFRVRKIGNQYRIVDVSLAGISMLITKRDEFNSVLAREGMQGLVQRLKATANG